MKIYGQAKYYFHSQATETLVYANNITEYVNRIYLLKCIDYRNLISILHGEERMTRLNGLPLNITNDPRFSLYAFH